MEVKIKSIEIILLAIDSELEGIDIHESTSKKVDYLNYRRGINLKKLKACQELQVKE